MAVINKKELKKLNGKEIDSKIKELKLELIKEQISSSKGGKMKSREIKKTIARLLTINRQKMESIER